MAAQRSSIPIKGVNSPVASSPDCSRTTVLPSAWMARVAGGITCLLNDLWKSVKYEEVYLKAYDGVPDAKANLAAYLRFYNQRRPHSSLDGMTPDGFYFQGRPQDRAAA